MSDPVVIDPPPRPRPWPVWIFFVVSISSPYWGQYVLVPPETVTMVLRCIAMFILGYAARHLVEVISRRAEK